MSWLDPVAQVLDDAPAPVTVFFRDDDAGWNNEALAELLDRFERWEVPMDLAVIPSEITAPLARVLIGRSRGGLVHLHQHGYTHTNHQTEGRKCEFGTARAAARQRADVAAGRAVLADNLGDHLEAVFTPPWNRCGQNTGEILADLGFRVLSRDHTAEALVPGTIAEVPVTIDWFGKTRAQRWSRDELGRRIARSLAEDRSTGIMLHHAVMDAADLAAVDALLALLASHSAVQRSHITALA